MATVQPRQPSVRPLVTVYEGTSMRDEVKRYPLGRLWDMSQTPSVTRADPMGPFGGSGLLLSFPGAQGVLGRVLQAPTCASECLQPPLPPCSRSVPGRKTGHLGQGQVLGSAWEICRWPQFAAPHQLSAPRPLTPAQGPGAMSSLPRTLSLISGSPTPSRPLPSSRTACGLF